MLRDRRLDRIALQGNGSARPLAAGAPAVEQAGHAEQHGATHPGAGPPRLTVTGVQGWKISVISVIAPFTTTSR